MKLESVGFFTNQINTDISPYLKLFFIGNRLAEFNNTRQEQALSGNEEVQEE